MQGSGDSPASERGLRQGEATNRALADIKLDMTLSGPQWRHIHTAYAILGPDPMIVKTDCRLREQHMGDWEGVPIADLLRDHGELFRAWREGRDCPENGEKHEALRERVTDAWMTIAGNAVRHEQDVLVVTSSMPIRAILGHVLDLPISSWRAIAVDNCSITILRHKDDGYWQVETLNDTHHLREVGVNKTFV